MDWIRDYHLFLFDFDGLLVNTEEIHFFAYKKMCLERGINLEWTFEQYCSIAHYSSDGLRQQIYKQYPDLYSQEPVWEILYSEKKQFVSDFLREREINLMSGVQELLREITRASKLCCVVTHSPDEIVKIAREKNPILNAIPYWFTREHYTKPKPDPECYLKAIDTLSLPNDRIIGFEDTPRGLRALMKTRAHSILISNINYPEIPSLLDEGAIHFPSFGCISKEKLSGYETQIKNKP